MAKQVIEKITDDIDGSADAQTYRFGWGSDTFEIDLAPKNAAKLEKALAPFIDAGRVVRERRGRRGRSRSSSAPDRAETQRVREWAKKRGYPIKDRGRVPVKYVEEYRAQR